VRGRPLALRVLASAALSIVTTCALLLSRPFSGTYALPAGFQEYYILGNETQVLQMMSDISPDPVGSSMASIITIVATSDGQIVYYDHWEDGYEPNILSPVQASTQVFGDGVPASDILNAGDIVTLNSDGGSGAPAINRRVPVPRGTALRYDSSDRLVSIGGSIDVVHALWPEVGTYMGGVWEVYPVGAWATGYSYVVPVGVDLYDVPSPAYFPDFQYVWLEIQALEDNTTVHINNGLEDVSIRLERGQSYSSGGYIDGLSTGVPSIPVNAGTTLLANKPIQGGLVTGRSNYQTRFFTLVPDTDWGTEYVAPIPRTDPLPAEVYLFNPDTSSRVVTAYDLGAPTGTTFVLAGATPLAYQHPSAVGRYVPAFSALRLRANGPLWAVASASTNFDDYDWGFSFVPTRFAGRDYYVSWAPGSDGNIDNASPVWVTPLGDNTVFSVDYSDPTADGTPDEYFALDALQTRRVYDPTDGDNTGMRIQADKPFVAVWGEDPSLADDETGLDMGYPVLPLDEVWLDPVLTLHKTPKVQVIPPAGGVATFALHAEAARYPVGSLNVTDTLSLDWTYVPGSAQVTYPNGSTQQVEPQIAAQRLSWPLSTALAPNQGLTLTFQAQFTNTAGLGQTCYDSLESGGYAGGSGWSGPWTASPSLTNTTDATYGLPHGGSYHLRLSDNGVTSRAADLSAFQRPFLRFWRRLNSIEASDSFRVRLWDGAQWTTVMTLTANSDPGLYVAEQFDLAPYRSSNFALQFQGVNSEADDYLYLDDVTISDAAATQTNTAEATGTYQGYLFSSRDEARVILSPLTLSQSVDKATAVGGDALTYTLIYTNDAAGATATNVLVHSVLPANTTYLSASPGAAYLPAAHMVVWGLAPAMTLPPGATGTLTVSASVDQWASNGQILRSEAYIDSDETPEVASNDAETIVLAPELSLTKSGPALAAPGQVVTYTIEYANSGAFTATGVIITDVIPVSTTYRAGSLAIDTGTGAVSLTDAEDGDAGYFTGSALSVRPGRLVAGQVGPGESGVIRFAVTVSPAAPLGGNVANHATVVRDYARPQNSALLLTAVTDLTLNKAADRTVVEPGDEISYTVSVESSAGITQTDVYIRDSIPGQTSYLPSTAIVPPGFSLSYSVDYGQSWTSTPPPTPTLVTDLRWYAPSLSGTIDVTLGYSVRVQDPLSQTNVVILNRAQIESAQMAPLYSNEVSIPIVDLLVDKAQSYASVVPGQVITYAIAYGNNGSAVAPGAVITDLLPAYTELVPGSISGGGTLQGRTITWTVGLPPGGAGSVQFAVVVTSPAPSGVDTLTNTVVLAEGHGFTATDTVTALLVAAPDLAVSKTADRAIASAGEVLTYTLVVSNVGTQEAKGVTLLDTLPAGVTFVDASGGGVEAGGVVAWPAFALAGGTNASRTLSVRVNDPLPPGLSVLTNIVSATDDGTNGPDLDPGDNVFTHTLPAEYNPVIRILKEGPLTANVGDTAIFTFTVTHDNVNGDGSPVDNLTVTDSIAGAASYVRGDSDGDGQLQAGETWVFEASYQILPLAPSPLVNTATVTGYDRDGDLIQAADTHSTTIEFLPTLKIFKEGPATARLGETVTYTFTIANASFTPTLARPRVMGDGSPITDLVVDDSIVSPLDYVGGDANTDGVLDVGEIWTYRASYTIRDTDPDPLVNVGTATGRDGNGDVVTDSDVHSLDIEYTPILQVHKEGPSTASVGDSVAFTLTVTNDASSGDGSTIDVTSITDTLLGTPTYVSGDDGDGLLQGGESWIYVGSYVILATDTNPLSSTCTVTGNDRDGEALVAMDTHHMYVEGQPYLVQLPLVVNGQVSSLKLYIPIVERH
jgi:uncharacterized repeat protein (TIGR01451 family)